jgi:hypothetical protein
MNRKQRFDGLCQEARPQSEWPYEKPDWIVTRVMLAPGGYSSFYPVYVYGINLNYAEGDPSRHFAWNVPLPLDCRHDLTNAEYGPGVLPEA